MASQILELIKCWNSVNEYKNVWANICIEKIFKMFFKRFLCPTNIITLSKFKFFFSLFSFVTCQRNKTSIFPSIRPSTHFVLLFYTAWKVSVFRVSLVHIFLHFDWIRRGAPYLSVFSPNGRKYGIGKLRIWTLHAVLFLYLLKI